MKRRSLVKLALPAFALSLALAACGGGGGGGGTTVAAIPASLTGQLTGSSTSFASATVDFSCGCTLQAGQVTADATGTYVLPVSAAAVPASPSPTYTTVPGRNYMIIGTSGSNTQSWTMGFLGNTPATDLNLYGTSSVNLSDQYTTAAALYVYYQSQSFTGDQTYDRWNFNTIVKWALALKQSSANNAAETQLLSDIQAQQVAHAKLWPSLPVWDPNTGDTPNTTIASDLSSVASSGDSAIPTPCPSTGCIGAPSP